MIVAQSFGFGERGREWGGVEWCGDSGWGIWPYAEHSSCQSKATAPVANKPRFSEVSTAKGVWEVGWGEGSGVGWDMGVAWVGVRRTNTNSHPKTKKPETTTSNHPIHPTYCTFTLLCLFANHYVNPRQRNQQKQPPTTTSTDRHRAMIQWIH